MSFLTPLYILGALAIVGPIVFHLIRRMPKGEVPFSSLMFLTPTPPRLTRRSRIDHWLLLLLRAAALALLAFAFARPFLRVEARVDPGEAERRRVLILLDTSASMRRGDLWPRAKAIAAEVIDRTGPGDALALIAFDTSSRTLLGFAESATIDSARRREIARAHLNELAPTWGGTDLGQALIDAVAALQDVRDASESAGRMPRRVVLVGDLQRGSDLDALRSFEWPPDVDLELRTVADDRPNAGLQWLAADPDDDDRALRVRVANEPGSSRDRFALTWADVEDADSVEVYVPPGESRVVRVPKEPGSPRTTLTLSGDAQAFDNTIYLADVPREESTVLFLGPDAPDDPAGLHYYVARAFHDTPRRTVTVRPAPPAEPLLIEEPESVPLVILTSDTTPANLERLKTYAREGGTVLVVLRAPEQADSVAALVGAPGLSASEADVSRDAMLGAIEFGHPLFAPFAGPQFNDFTKIHFWKYRKLDPSALPEARVLARFEDGDPALIEAPVVKGRVMVLTSGWHPADSQLARSSKFVPLMLGLLEGPGGPTPDTTDLLVHDPMPLPPTAEGAAETTVETPDGSRLTVPAGESAFTRTDAPGIYSIESDEHPLKFAVNLDPAESRTAPLEVETLEQLGCRLASREAAAPDAEQLRQLRNAELEGRQKVWRSLIVAALGILIVETWLAGRQPRPRPARAEALAS